MDQVCNWGFTSGCGRLLEGSKRIFYGFTAFDSRLVDFEEIQIDN